MTRFDRTDTVNAGRKAALALRHAALEAAIGSEHARPVPDMATLQTLKRKRLIVKEELFRLGASHVPRRQR